MIVVSLAVLIALTAVVVVLLALPEAPKSPPPTGVVLDRSPNASAFPTPAGFWGANIGSSSPITGVLTADLAPTPTMYYRWPGGQAGDGINYSTGQLTNASTGGASGVTLNLTGFVAWCKTAGCHAILQLPAEIDSPSTAAYDVAYTEQVLQFRPAYWEIGNEPAIWSHFQIPWSQWAAGQNVNATPAAFATVVQQYVAAIHGVDPSAAIIGLGGIGTGTYGEASWIAATVRLNGPNLSAVAIHVYPAGTPPNGTATLAQFYANLTGSRSLEGRVPADRQAIAGACPTCTGLQLFVTEYGSASSPGSFTPYEQAYPQVPFVASEVIDGLNLNVAQMDLRQVATPHSGSWLDTGSGATHPLYALYATLLPQLGPTLLPSTIAPRVGGFYAVATGSSANTPTTLLLDNANPTTTVQVILGTSLAARGSLEVWSWNASTNGPVESNLTVTPSSVWTLPPLSLLLLRSTGTPFGATVALVAPASTALGFPAGGGPVAARVAPVSPLGRR